MWETWRLAVFSGDEQRLADLSVDPPLGDQGEDLSLTLGQAE
jgi:hypothetical protein